MAFISVFDVLGPNMIGPSSSHTAGAAKIAYLAQKMIGGKLKRADFTLYGSFAETYSGHGTDRALLGGILGFEQDDKRIRGSYAFAEDAGLAYSFTPNFDETEIYPNTVDIRMENDAGQTLTVRGESVGGGKVRITRIDGVEVDFSGEYSAVIVIHLDRPGLVAHISKCLCDRNVNIAFMRLFRESKGSTAYSIVESDGILPEGLTEDLYKNEFVRNVMIVQAGVREMDFKNAQELLAICEEKEMKISSVMLRRECDETECTAEEARGRMKKAMEIMRDSVTQPIAHPRKSMGGLIGGEAAKLSGKAGRLCGALLGKAMCCSMGVLEVNASMGLIVAAPTAGSSGVVPGLLLAMQDELGFSDEEIVEALFNAGAVGYLAMRNATVAGAVGGCQAEIGVAAAMAASAAVELMGGTPKQCLDAAGTVLMNMLGLVCDPVGGLVEYPCQSRNAAGVANAVIAAEIALAGIEQLIPFDEMLDTMFKVGRKLPAELRETALGGCAATPTACKLCRKHK